MEEKVSDALRSGRPERARVRRILLVDDDEVLLRSTARVLRRRWQVRTAWDYDDAVAIVEREPIDLAFVDLMLGHSSGIALIRELKRMRPQLTAILVSGYASIDVAVEAAHAGASEVHCKPVDLLGVVSALRTTSSARSRRRQIPSLIEMERAYIRRVIEDCNGNVARAARLLGTSRSSLYRKIGAVSRR